MERANFTVLLVTWNLHEQEEDENNKKYADNVRCRDNRRASGGREGDVPLPSKIHEYICPANTAHVPSKMRMKCEKLLSD